MFVGGVYVTARNVLLANVLLTSAEFPPPLARNVLLANVLLTSAEFTGLVWLPRPWPTCTAGEMQREDDTLTHVSV